MKGPWLRGGELRSISDVCADRAQKRKGPWLRGGELRSISDVCAGAGIGAVLCSVATDHLNASQLDLHIFPSECAQTVTHVQLCHPMDCSPPGSSVHGILWARILE